MKINELLTWKNEPSSQKNQQESADFKHWLDDTSTPSKQSSGDEYYWQHQTQLQQSSLRFDAKPIESYGSNPILPNNDEHAFKLPMHQDIVEQKEPEYLPNESADHVNNKMADTKEFIAIIAALEETIEQSQIPNVTNNQFTTEPNAKSKDIKRSDVALNHIIQFKNNHLFILGEQAELTLNLHHFNKQEQKELIQMIQDHLKKKGLIVSRLIINGVKND